MNEDLNPNAQFRFIKNPSLRIITYILLKVLISLKNHLKTEINFDELKIILNDLFKWRLNKFIYVYFN